MTDKEIYTEVSKLPTIYNEQERVAALEGAKWMRKQMITIACEWLKRNYGHFDGSTDDLISDFRKAIEGE